MRLRILVLALAALASSWISPAVSHADTVVDVYATPGVHLVNGRYWKTSCAHYSPTVVRCTTEIYATKVFLEGGRWYKQNTWVFNNLSYLPSAREQWAGNPLAQTGSWTATDGRKWRTECDTAVTGRGACRNYVEAMVASDQGGLVKQYKAEVLNSMVRFDSSTVPAVTAIPPAAPVRTDVPAPGPKQPIGVAAPAKPAPSTSGSAAPSNGQCPASHPIKGNANSGIYHVKGQQYYNATKAEECFATESAAIAAGYRKSKV
ncbi:sunset domain-containing protein [Tessaracoccus sp. G1721]